MGLNKNESKMGDEKGFTWDEINEQTWKEKMHLILPYLKLDVISLAKIWNIYLKEQHILSGGIDIKRCVSAPSLAWKGLLLKLQNNNNIHFFKSPICREYV